MMRQASPRGMALVAVLWIVAALSIMALALAGTTRVQVRTASVQRMAASVQAAGEAATALALQELLALRSQQELQEGVQHISVQWQGKSIPVQLTPLDGYIALNSANAEMFATVLQSAGGLDGAQAQALAEVIVAWRDGTDVPLEKQQAPRRFEAVQDLMLVPGMDYGVYTRIAPLVTADVTGSAVNALSAPAAVLYALAGGQDALVGEYIARRSEPGADASFFNPAFVHARGGSSLYRARADVPLDEGTIARFECDVALRIDRQRSAPWTLLRQGWSVASLQP